MDTGLMNETVDCAECDRPLIVPEGWETDGNEVCTNCAYEADYDA